MEQHYWCPGRQDVRMAEKRLADIPGLGAITTDAANSRVTVRSFSQESAVEAALRLRELGFLLSFTAENTP